MSPASSQKLTLELDSMAAETQAPPAFNAVSASSYATWGKRTLDLAVATTLLLVAIIPMGLIALMVCLNSPGNPFFTQRRVGKDGRNFVMIKFRTMTKQHHDGLVFLQDFDGTYRHKIRTDPRVTGIGRWLRRSSLDEMPQLINVIRGDMSMVGPRPELPQLVANYEAWQHRRHAVRPGITGWWQVNGRSDQPMHENTELDVFYIENMSPKLDAAIALRTIKVVAHGIGSF